MSEKKMFLTLYTCRPDRRFVRRFDITNRQAIIDCELLAEDYTKEKFKGGDLEAVEVWLTNRKRDVFFWGADNRFKNFTGGVSLAQAVKDRICGTCLDLIFETQEMMRDSDERAHHPKCLTGKQGFELADRPLDEDPPVPGTST